MALKLMSAIITDVKVALYQDSGPSAQIYSDTIIQQMIQDGFDAVFLKRFWHAFDVREQLILDGTTGKTTVAPTYLKFYEDVQNVFFTNSRRPIPKLPSTFNTLSLTGTTPRFVAPSGDSKLVKIYPITSTGNVLLVGRRRPTAYITSDTVEFDATCLRHFACFRYYADDGSNPASMGVHQGLFEARLAELIEADQQFSVPLDNQAMGIPSDWYVDGTC